MVNTAVAQERQFRAFAYQKGYQQRADPVGEIVPAESRLAVGELRFVHDEYPVAFHLGENLPVGLFERALQSVEAVVYPAQQGFQRVAALHLFGARSAQEHHPFEVGHAHFEKLVLIVGIDTQKPQPLEQRYAAVLRFLHDAFVEGNPA